MDLLLYLLKYFSILMEFILRTFNNSIHFYNLFLRIYYVRLHGYTVYRVFSRNKHIRIRIVTYHEDLLVFIMKSFHKTKM